MVNRYTCTCAAAYTGDRCETGKTFAVIIIVTKGWQKGLSAKMLLLRKSSLKFGVSQKFSFITSYERTLEMNECDSSTTRNVRH